MKLPRQLTLLTATVCLVCAPVAGAVVKPPVQWHIKAAPAKQIKAGTKFNVTISGDLDPGWHLYALEEPEGGPVATEVSLTEGDPADLIRVEEAKPKVLPDPLFQKPTGFFEHTAEFTLHLQATKDAGAASKELHILVRYQSCNERVCLPPRTDTITVPLAIGLQKP
jgi:hypothetical protein